jgi:branched-chain amino acid transport system permease protein
MPVYLPDVIGLFVSSSNASQDASNYSEILYGLLIMVFMIKAPTGLAGLFRAGGRKVLARWNASRASR